MVAAKAHPLAVAAGEDGARPLAATGEAAVMVAVVGATAAGPLAAMGEVEVTVAVEVMVTMAAAMGLPHTALLPRTAAATAGAPLGTAEAEATAATAARAEATTDAVARAAMTIAATAEAVGAAAAAAAAEGATTGAPASALEAGRGRPPFRTRLGAGAEAEEAVTAMTRRPGSRIGRNARYTGFSSGGALLNLEAAAVHVLSVAVLLSCN